VPHSVAHDDYPPIIDLSEANQRIIHALFGDKLHLIFKKVPDASYRTKLDMKKLGRYVRSAFHLEAFDIFGYKRTVRPNSLAPRGSFISSLLVVIRCTTTLTPCSRGV
jgi:hypothetical protein